MSNLFKPSPAISERTKFSQNPYTFYALQEYVELRSGLIIFKEVFHIPDLYIKNLDDLLIRRENTQCSTSGKQPSEYGKESSNEEILGRHDFSPELLDLILKLIAPIKRAFMLKRLHTIVQQMMVLGPEFNPMGQNPYDVEAINLPVEVRIFILLKALQYRVSLESSMKIDNFYDAVMLRQNVLGQDTRKNTYLYFCGATVWVELNSPPKYIPWETIDQTDVAWDIVFEEITKTNKPRFVAIADFDRDPESWDFLKREIKKGAVCANFSKVYAQQVPTFKQEIERRLEEQRQKEDAERREILAQLEREKLANPRRSTRIRANESYFEESRRKIIEQERMLDALGYDINDAEFAPYNGRSTRTSKFSNAPAVPIAIRDTRSNRKRGLIPEDISISNGHGSNGVKLSPYQSPVQMESDDAVQDEVSHEPIKTPPRSPPPLSGCRLVQGLDQQGEIVFHGNF